MEGLLDFGYIGLFVGAFLAATVIPFSSDVLLISMLAAGANVYIAVTVATLGNWLGGLSSYWIGYLGKWSWMEKYLGVNREKLEKQKHRIDKYGSWLAFFTWLPIIGDIMAVALGFYKTDLRKTAIFMFIGKCLRFIGWAVLFYWIRPMF